MNDGIHGEELWRSATLSSTPTLLKDLVPGSFSSQPREFAAFNNRLYFAANQEPAGNELWYTDGTQAGTVKLSMPFDGVIRNLTVAGGKLYFKLNFSNQEALYVTDGTESGTRELMQFPNHPSQFYPDPMVAYNEMIYLRAAHPTMGLTLWKSDGTVAGTVPVKPGPSAPQVPNEFHVYNNLLYFTSLPARIWRTDGTPAGTFTVSNLDIGMGARTIHKGNLYFTTTYSPTERLGRINTAGQLDIVFTADEIELLGAAKWGILLRVRQAPGGDSQLWVSTGTTNGTVPLTTLSDQGTVFTPVYCSFILNSAIVIARGNSATGDKVWITNGTVQGTKLVSHAPRSFISRPPVVKLQRAFTWAWEPDGVYRLDYFSGSTAGNGKVKIPLTTDHSSPTSFVQLNDQVLFTAYTPQTGYELWKTKGIQNDVQLVMDIWPGGLGNHTHHRIVHGNRMFFGAEDVQGWELWTTDGTTDGTYRVRDIFPGSVSSLPNNFFVVNSAVYFWARNDQYIDQLWTTDGTEAGTIPVVTVGPPVAETLITAGGFTYFYNNQLNGADLMRTDGTQSGTVLVAHFASVGLAPGAFCLSGTGIYFSADDGTSGLELWRVDTVTYTIGRVKDIYPGSSPSSPRAYQDMNGLLYFSADDGIHGHELWVTDGSESGTSLVADISPGLPGSSPGFPAVFQDKLYFSAEDPAHGRELWRSGGDASSTTLVLDIEPGADPSNPQGLIVAQNRLFFKAIDLGLWSIAEGGQPTRAPFNDLFQLNFMSWNLFPFGSIILFAGVTPQHSAELWAIDFRQDQFLSAFSVEDKHVDDPDFPLETTASSGLPVSYYSTDPGVITIEGNVADIVGGGEVTLGAVQAGNAYWKPVLDEVTIQVSKNTQVITFDNPPDTVGYSPAIPISATSTSGLPVFLELEDLFAGEISDDSLRLPLPGSVVVTAQQDGDERFDPAPVVTRTIHIAKLYQFISFNSPDTVSESALNVPLFAGSDSGLPITFVAETENLQIAGQTFSSTAPGIGRVTASQPGNELYSAATSVTREFCIAPDKPTLVLLPLSLVLQSSRANDNYWFLDGEQLLSETGQTLDMSQYEPGHVRVQIIVEGCRSPKSEAYLILGNEITWLPDDNAVEAFPNPVKNILIVQAKGVDVTELSLFDMAGRHLPPTQRSALNELDVSSLPAGIYFLIVSTNQSRIVIKIVKE